ncbi:hypothetical protein HRJ34_00950 [Rhizorhabdus wittichii]|uniref:Uncharacterized protein n=1 Tax=Rhizorhabdus wittichii TaxID=160791 RepID=A0A975HEA0_9SPHN|nr:hypothetical protein [Rhizorhabdus wittichii]QTH22138.1 hypothetical protein HRJ34_00950 [Rhizorhabdus wittichii]
MMAPALAGEAGAAPLICKRVTYKKAVMLNAFQHPPIIRTVAACGTVDAETRSA